MKVQVKKSWTHEGPRKKVGHMKVQGKKRKDSHVKKESKKRERIKQNGVTTNQMVITSTQSGPSVHLTILMFIIHMVISSTHFGPSIHLTILLTDKRRIPLRSASVRTTHLFHHGIPKVLVNPRSKGITNVRSTFTL
jgi:hypothetical protein